MPETVTREQARKFYETMCTIRCFEESVKKSIFHKLNHMTEEKIKQSIKDISELFVSWRYNYEYEGYSTHYSFVFDYAKALKESLEQEISMQVDYSNIEKNDTKV